MTSAGSHRYLVEHLLVDAAAEVISDAVIDVVDGRVVWSGPADAVPERGPDDSATTRLDGLVMPGLVNAHCHTPMLLMRGAGEGLDTVRWLNEVIWPRESALRAPDIAAAMRLGAAEMLRNGVTTTVEMYFYGHDMATAAVDVGLRSVITPPLIDDGALAGFGPLDEQLAAIVDLADRWADDDLIDIGLGPHAAYSLSRATLEQVAATAADSGLMVHIHLAEQPHEADAVTERTGLSAPAYLDEIGLLGPRTLAAHGVWLSDADIELLAERGVAVAHCPVSNGRHGSGIAPVAELRAAGVRVGLGTDGPVSHDRIDLFEDLRTAIRYARLRHHDAAAMPARQALSMALCGDAIGRDDLGHLLPGAAADFIRIDLDVPEFEPVFEISDLPERLAWVGHGGLVSDVWVAGRQRVANRAVVALDLDEARAEVRARARDLVTRTGS